MGTKMYREYQASKLPKPATRSLKPTTADIEGPFYKAGAPLREGIMDLDRPSDANLCVQGKVLTTEGLPVVGAILDVWQADDKGVYDNGGFHLRGKFQADGKGHYRFETIRPGN